MNIFEEWAVCSTEIWDGYVTINYDLSSTLYHCTAKEALQLLMSDVGIETEGVTGFVIHNGIVTFVRDFSSYNYVGQVGYFDFGVTP